MHERTLEQLKEGVKIIRNPEWHPPNEDGEYEVTVSDNGRNIRIKKLR